MKEIQCKTCSTLFGNTRKTRFNEFYCSRACYNVDHWKTTSCKVCSSVFKHHCTKKRIFCSISCSNKSRYEERKKVCAFCKIEFRAMNFKLYNVYCSKECYDNSGQRKIDKTREKNPHYIKGKFSYRAFAFRELPNECAICKGKEKLDAHHIDGDRENNELWNLIILCHKCHMKYHHNTLDLDSF